MWYALLKKAVLLQATYLPELSTVYRIHSKKLSPLITGFCRRWQWSISVLFLLPGDNNCNTAFTEQLVLRSHTSPGCSVLGFNRLHFQRQIKVKHDFLSPLLTSLSPFSLSVSLTNSKISSLLVMPRHSGLSFFSTLLMCIIIESAPPDWATQRIYSENNGGGVRTHRIQGRFIITARVWYGM